MDPLNHPDLKYGGEALALLGIAYRLLSWAWRTKEEIEAPPGISDAPTSAWLGLSGIADAGRDFLSAIRHPLGGSSTTYITTATMTSDAPATTASTPNGERGGAARLQPQTPDVAPPTLLDALTPEQRALVLARLVQEEEGGTHSAASPGASPPSAGGVKQKP